KVAWLWAIHELHHSDECMNVTTTFRIHWLDSPLGAVAVGIFPAFLVPQPQLALPAWWILFRCTNNFWIHLNADIGFGWFNRIFASPQTHRIHHSYLPQHIDKNFAGLWTFWDVIFGTYIHPIKGEHPPTGLTSGKQVLS